MALTRHDPTMSYSFFFLTPPLTVGVLYQPQGVLGWLHTLVDSAPRILTGVDALTVMVRNGREKALQTLGRESHILVTPPPSLQYSMATQKSLLLYYSPNWTPGTK